MTTSDHIGIEDVTEGALQAHVPHNEAVHLLDIVARKAIKDRISATPGSPTSGDLYVITGTPTGQWLTDNAADEDVAIWLGARWHYFTPKEGWLMRVVDENVWTYYNGSAWVDLPALVMALAAALVDSGALTASTVTGSSGGSGDGALVDCSTAVTGVDGTANNAASKADVDARLVTIADNFEDLKGVLNAAIVDLETMRTTVNTLLANRRTALEQA